MRRSKRIDAADWLESIAEEEALGVIRLTLAEAMKDVAKMEACAELINPNSSLWGSVRIK